MKKTNLILIVIFALFVCNHGMAFTVELDPASPLTNYISMAEWNSDGDFEDWTYSAHIIDAQVIGGNFQGKDDGNDPMMNLNITPLTPPDPRMELATAVGTVFEVRMQFVTNTQNGRVDFWATINGAGPGSFPPMQFASAGGVIPDVPTDGQFHIFRLTLEEGDSYIGNLDALRIDPIADGPFAEIFKIDYIRIAKVTNQVQIIKVDPDPLFNYTSIAEWNTDNDFEDWLFNNIGSSNVSGGIMSGTSLNGDPHFYKTGVPQVDLDKAPIVEFRLKQTAAFTSIIEIYFGATDDPNFGGSTYATIPQSKVPTDGDFHVYQYNMSTVETWKKDLVAFRIDPYVGAGSVGKIFEIDYIRIGTTATPTINPSASEGTYPDKVVVTWDEGNNVNKYQVWRNVSNDSSTASTVSPELTTNIFDDTSVTPDVYYYYWVKAFITNDWGNFGDSDMGFATASTGPDTPVNLSPANGTDIPSFPIILQASDYSDQGGWPMEAVQWQVAPDTNFGYGKWDSGDILTTLTTIEPPSPIFGTQNYWRVRYKNDREKWSGWSTHTMFNFNPNRETNSPYFFYDTFNVPGIGDVNENYYLAGRQFGTAAPLNYTISGYSEVGSESGNPSELMLGLTSGVSPNDNFDDPGGFKIEFDVIPHKLDKTNDWVSLSFGKTDQSDLFPVSVSGAGLIFFGNQGFQAFDGETLVGSGFGVPNDEKLHIILTGYTELFDYEPVQYSAFANGIPMVVDTTTTKSSYIFNDENGYGNNYISLFSFNNASTNTSLFDNLKITKVENTVTNMKWLSDSDMLPMNPAKTTHAVNLNGESVTINGVLFSGTGTNFGGHANGSAILQSNGWQLMCSDGTVVFHNGENVTNIVTDPGTKTLMGYFAYFNTGGGLKLSGLSPYSTNIISLYSYGWEAGGRSVFFSSTSGGTILAVDQDTYGIGSGIIVRYSYVADKNGECTIVLSPAATAGWHLSGFYSEEVSAPAAEINVPNKIDFGEVAVGNNTTLPLEIMNMGAGEVSGSISGTANPFSNSTNFYYSTASSNDVVNLVFSPVGEGNFTNEITLTGSGGNAEVTLIGSGVPEPLSVIGYLLSVTGLFFARRK